MGVPWVRYCGTYKDLNINITGLERMQFWVGVDSVGSISASLVTYASILMLQPDLIINAGTAGGFKMLEKKMIGRMCLIKGRGALFILGT
ncbi:hypothetical protein RHSIM_Rhsim01G0041000 [Rhododendron simsii]|uniref:Nucleoside phosphorylase domain-containing protein n=1 Tax=Rhododendron simsii TaxID=118357 RepID=A0A834LYW8_RHOSS|nr:hypothetical protein RHSIM_Rhsim01G0041000 [Rhododendron simsii]